ncbi:MAG TPA: helix-turn-helix domain-containing protein, partial [Actinomycetota bacterium]|nr:helix-turn-helix domain-containing protein [Actinomycetota bacterium]
MPNARRTASTDTGVSTLDRAVAIIGAVEAGARTFTDVARTTRLPRSTAHRLLKALAAHGLLAFDPGDGYRLGHRLVQLGGRARLE